MKKIIATAAGLMIAGSALVASAAVEFSGDARARYEYLNADPAPEQKEVGGPITNEGKKSEDVWSHRVRLAVKANTAGGSFAKMRLRVEANWGATGNISDNAASDVTVDYAYVGVPMGCTLLTAGREPLNLLTGYFNDVGIDNARLTWSNNGTTLMALYGIVNQDNASLSTDITGFSDFSNSDRAPQAGVAILEDDESGTAKDDLFHVAWMQDWDGNWSSTVALGYANFDYSYKVSPAEVAALKKKGQVFSPIKYVDDAFMGVVAMSGQAGPVALHTEIGYQEKGIAASDDYYNSPLNNKDAVGGFVTAGMDFDALGMTLIGGYGAEGYIWDAALGFMLVGGDTQLSLAKFSNLGALGGVSADTAFGGLVTTYQATEDLGFLLNLGYVNVDNNDANIDANVFEVSGQAGYAVNDGTMLYARAGYANTDDVIFEDVFAAGVSLELSF